ncbi:reverse transcriptase domain-containing protein [Tanacetum coccineum]
MISKPMTQLLLKDAMFDFSDDCKKAFNILKENLATAPIIISLNWNIPFELMCDDSDYTVGAVLGQRVDGNCFHLYIDHSALKYLFNKQDVKPYVYDGFYYYKGLISKLKIENLAADHLSRLENPHMEILTEREIANEFPNEHLMMLKAKVNDVEPWYADYVNYIARRCVAGSKIFEILAHSHSRPTGGHHSASITGRKVYESGFFWPNIFKDANDYVMRTAYKTPTGCTPFRLAYGNACHLPVEIDHKSYWALKQCNMDLTAASKNHFMQLNELVELRDGAYENTIIYKERTKKWCDSRLRSDKDFKVGDKIVYLYGAVEITDKNGFSFKVNGQRLKKYYKGNINKEDEKVIEFEADAT